MLHSNVRSGRVINGIIKGLDLIFTVVENSDKILKWKSVC